MKSMIAAYSSFLYDLTGNFSPSLGGSTLLLHQREADTSGCFRKGDRTSFILSISRNDDGYFRTDT